VSTVLASAADRRYGWWLLNLVGSVQANARDCFDGIVLYDLGLTPLQRRLAASIRHVELREVPEFSPHWSQGFAWKPWIWTHVDADCLLYLDAGVTVLRRLDEPLQLIEEHGYFVVSQDRPFGEIVPSDYYALYGIPREWDERQYVAGGIIGFRKDGAFYSDVVVPTFEDCLAGRSLGFSLDEVDELNFGLQESEEAIVRDAERFRHDQTILNIHLFKSIPSPVIGELDRFGGYRSPHDHPAQVIWNHRRRGDLRYLPRVRYRMLVRIGGTAIGVGKWLALNRWLFLPSTYVRKVRRVLAGIRRVLYD
jgi:hypothetical protein